MIAALSGSQSKAPGFAGGYLLCANQRAAQERYQVRYFEYRHGRSTRWSAPRPIGCWRSSCVTSGGCSMAVGQLRTEGAGTLPGCRAKAGQDVPDRHFRFGGLLGAARLAGSDPTKIASRPPRLASRSKSDPSSASGSAPATLRSSIFPFCIGTVPKFDHAFSRCAVEIPIYCAMGI